MRSFRASMADANAFELFLLGACVVQGPALLMGLSEPTSIEATLSPGFRLGWILLLLFGGSAALVGIFWPWSPFTGVAIYRIGLIAAGFAMFVYGLVLLQYGAVGMNAAITNLALSAAAVRQARQMKERLQVAQRFVAAVNNEGG